LLRLELTFSPPLQILKDDSDASLATELAQEFPVDLDTISALLLRIYHTESILISRIFQLTEREINVNITTTAVLFRGNSILTKLIELYLRLVGVDYLEASIGEVVRKLCSDKVDLELDPARMKSGVKEKEIAQQSHLLTSWATVIWNSIYEARQRCPRLVIVSHILNTALLKLIDIDGSYSEIRQIFGHIQGLVETKFGTDENLSMKSTSVSAFLFLRYVHTSPSLRCTLYDLHC
jgi:ATP-dependent Lon protease